MKLFNYTMKVLFAIIHISCIGVYISCFFGVGLVLLPYAIGAHLGIWFWDKILPNEEEEV